MSTFVIYSRKHQQPIHSLEAWRRWGGPQHAAQWQDEHSAKECAKAWFRTGTPSVPRELADLFLCHPLTNGLVVRAVLPEVETKLDAFRGKRRAHDLVLLADGPAKATLVAIEAKAQESFGQTIRSEYAQSSRLSGSNIPQRIEQLIHAVFGRPLDDTLRSLRYQLLHAVAGTLIQAKQEHAQLAVFVVHELASNTRLRAHNHADLQHFLNQLCGSRTPTIPQNEPFLVGPFQVPGGAYVPGNVPLLIGKVSAPSV